jgi:hypothetical protein
MAHGGGEVAAAGRDDITRQRQRHYSGQRPSVGVPAAPAKSREVRCDSSSKGGGAGWCSLNTMTRWRRRGKGQILMMHVKSEEEVCTRRRMKLAQFPFACHL